MQAFATSAGRFFYAVLNSVPTSEKVSRLTSEMTQEEYDSMFDKLRRVHSTSRSLMEHVRATLHLRAERV